MTEIQFRSDVVTKLTDSMPKFMGDESVIEAMLVSTDNVALVKEMESIESIRGRIRFLMRKRHGTPFEHNAMKFYVEAPIFVFREWHRHRIGFSYNEQSGRYSELPPMFYIPPPERGMVQVGKPGNQHVEPGTVEQYARQLERMERMARLQYSYYQDALADGIAKEVARMHLGVNIYSKMFCTCNARSLMAFLSLRTKEDPFWQYVEPTPGINGEVGWIQNPGGAMFPSGPMWEIEQAARLAEDAFARLFPFTYEAFCEFGRVAP